MSEWREFRVRFIRSWNQELKRRQEVNKDQLVSFSASWPRNAHLPDWGVKVDTKNRGGVNLTEALNGWREHVVNELMTAISCQKQLSVGPLIVDESRLETQPTNRILLILETRVVLAAETAEQAADVLVALKQSGRLPDDIVVLSDLERLAGTAREKEEV